MKFEQLSFSIDTGEIVAPVSSLYREFVMEILSQHTLTKNGNLYNKAVDALRRCFEGNDLYKMVNNQTKQEIEELFSLPFEMAHELFYGEEIDLPTPEELVINLEKEEAELRKKRETIKRFIELSSKKDTNNNTNVKPKLKLVK